MNESNFLCFSNSKMYTFLVVLLLQPLYCLPFQSLFRAVPSIHQTNDVLSAGAEIRPSDISGIRVAEHEDCRGKILAASRGFKEGDIIISVQPSQVRSHRLYLRTLSIDADIIKR